MRAIHEKFNGLIPSQVLDSRRLLRIRYTKRRYAEDRFASDPQRLSTGRKNAQIRGGAKQCIGKLSARADQMLAVVQYK
jgi:hypothetical protein